MLVISSCFSEKKSTSYQRAFSSGTPGGNRTHNGPLGGGCYIHLTTEADLTSLLYRKGRGLTSFIAGSEQIDFRIKTFFKGVDDSLMFSKTDDRCGHRQYYR